MFCKCFILHVTTTLYRKDYALLHLFGIAIYRGCTDGFSNVPSLEHSYVGCRNQTWNNRNLRWCICNTTLCNGDSLEAMARRRPYARHLLTPPPLPSYRRPEGRQVPVETQTDEEVHGQSSVEEDDAKAGLYQPWNPEPIYDGGPYLWNPNNKPFRTYRKTSSFSHEIITDISAEISFCNV